MKIQHTLYNFFKKNEWIKENLAEDCFGKIVSPKHPDANQYCLLGACQKLDGLKGMTFNKLYDRLIKVLSKKSIISIVKYNDKICKDKKELLEFLYKNKL